MRATQLGSNALLSGADSENRGRTFERETAHLPGTMVCALPYYRGLLDRHHAAMLAADAEEAHKLERKLNGGEPGIIAISVFALCA